jgi:hypothetical protein
MILNNYFGLVVIDRPISIFPSNDPSAGVEGVSQPGSDANPKQGVGIGSITGWHVIRIN